MPHNIIEYSSELEPDIENIMQAVHLGSVNSALFDEQDIKTRALPYRHANLGQDSKFFIHVQAKILSGRSPEQKSLLSDAILQQLIQLELSAISLTVEILDIDKSSYAKQVIGA
ncbi:5-carboxymethyl-2-hydroxymuconate Delta-isomerase [Thalassomonas viridans]|uniref:5-carboxymethyl-2-hydroxymuconate Delta-isomerase n=1 Tax=Thalassomonas viridans TaxID=137584 RepID=A0AAE9Z0D7_9GAMM|nr:5-carboxymethyl-2-hydroxymuconate Delta-isomerase [Thalassomonas viridans]WDE04315.1 5-carboxymethyl-2-hydroxymuconate Delta-isomerase [Thalassomonas viridans]